MLHPDTINNAADVVPQAFAQLSRCSQSLAVVKWTEVVGRVW